ncbi:putative UDP-N-acetylglucosamine--peptide N-acetylglucosaminyltransferase SPINDLY [Iris pallida]|uniref:UDP-N-acetylglucosamine--peptide N-acetylglucosaminyltransferase SPINDLY n=2 Tax=Iris pallida TaxID=29817 RepID=A0AAX6DXW2_IRIPA|nr:putative UDP-N-acetylglucosamine--peptide N-acetylglucosaminyltransferase SPINDLY [Iris pallida]
MLEQLGLEPLRVDLLPLILLNHDHMQAYSLMDISLDTFPYAGTTTTCESLYMGVPCVTMAGSVHAHNVGVSLLHNVGLGRLIAKTEEEYIRLALQLASDVSTLSELRMTLRELMVKSLVCDGAKFARGLESAFRNMWQRYCRGDVPSLKHLDSLQLQQPNPERISVMFSDVAKNAAMEELQNPPVNMNGVNVVSLATSNVSNFADLNPPADLGKKS